VAGQGLQGQSRNLRRTCASALLSSWSRPPKSFPCRPGCAPARSRARPCLPRDLRGPAAQLDHRNYGEFAKAAAGLAWLGRTGVGERAPPALYRPGPGRKHGSRSDGHWARHARRRIRGVRPFPNQRRTPGRSLHQPQSHGRVSRTRCLAPRSPSPLPAHSYGQRVWKTHRRVLAAGAISTLSRGSVLAWGRRADVFVLAPRSDEGEPLHRSRFAAVLLALLVVVGATIAWAATRSSPNSAAPSATTCPALVSIDALPMRSPIRLALDWAPRPRLSRVSDAALAGLARNSWRTSQSVSSSKQECGALGFLLRILVLVGRRFWKSAPGFASRPRWWPGWFGCLPTTLVDFGLEPRALLLPFCALLGAIFGRQAIAAENPAPNRSPAIFAAVACLAAVAGIGLLRAPGAPGFRCPVAAAFHPGQPRPGPRSRARPPDGFCLRAG